MRLKHFYLVMAIVGTIIPWLFFGSFFATSGVDIVGFVRLLFANGPAAGFSSDILISILVFWVWSYADARHLGVGNWWLVLPAGFCVGLSLALPLYFYLRADESARRAT